MRLRIAICTKEKKYAERLYFFWNRYYNDKLEIGIYDNPEYLKEHLKKYSLDFVLFGEEWKAEVETESEAFPAYAYLVEKIWYAECKDECTEIEKYQRGDSIYRDLMDAYAAFGRIRRENSDTGESNSHAEVLVFLSPGSGSGASTIANVYARKCAQSERVLLLNMQFCSGGEEENGHGMDDILFALKSRRYILPLKLEASIRISEDKVARISLCSNPMDMLSVSSDEMKQLLEAIQNLNRFDKIVIDMDSIAGEKEKLLLEKAEKIICVVDESDSTMRKFQRFCKALSGMQQVSGEELESKLRVFCNKMQTAVQRSPYWASGIVCGSAPKYQDALWEDIIKILEASATFMDMWV